MTVGGEHEHSSEWTLSLARLLLVPERFRFACPNTSDRLSRPYFTFHITLPLYEGLKLKASTPLPTWL